MTVEVIFVADKAEVEKCLKFFGVPMGASFKARLNGVMHDVWSCKDYWVAIRMEGDK